MSEEDKKKVIECFRELYDVTIPDLDYYLRQIDCRDGCPVKTDGRGYMLALHAGNLLEGIRLRVAPIPLHRFAG